MRIAVTEETRPIELKVVDPALMTFDEYRKVANPSGKHHPSDAYDATLASLNSYQRIAEFDYLVRRFVSRGIKFELRRSSNDRLAGNYIKYDANHEPVRVDGDFQYYTTEELLQMYPHWADGPARYAYQFAIIDTEQQKIVAVTQDEWGALLVMVAREYRGFGLGTIITKEYRAIYPTADSGGFTSGGLSNLRRVHTAMVRDYMSSGFYSKLVRDGVLTKEQVAAIIGDIEPRKKHDSISYDTSDPKDWLLFHDGSTFLIYHKSIYDLDMDEIDDHWQTRYVIGYIHVMGNSQLFANAIHASTDNVRALLISLVLSSDIFEPDDAREVYIAADDMPKTLPPNSSLRSEPVLRRGDVPMSGAWVKVTADETKAVDYTRMVRAEAMYRKKHDPYDEAFIRIHELADKISR